MLASVSLNKYLFPKPLKKGDKIAVVAPGSVVDEQKLAQGIKAIEEFGFEVERFGELCKLSEGQFCNDVSSRVDAIHEALEDNEVGAIICARGGYGSSMLLKYIDYQLFAKRRKALVGFSDITALLNAVTSQSGLITYSGASVAVEFSDHLKKDSQQALLSLLMGETQELEYFGQRVQGSGDAQGALFGGNLATFMTLFGTPWLPRLKDNILFLEDINEPPYKIHRMFAQLDNAGVFEEIAGIVFGRFSTEDDKEGINFPSCLEKLYRDFLFAYDLPILYGVEFGHLGVNMPIPIGATCKISEDRLCITI